MNPLKRGWKAVSFVFRQEKKWLGLLVLIQILFIILISIIGVKYLINISESARGVIEPLEGLNYEEIEQSQGEINNQIMQDLMKQMLLVAESYETLIGSIIEMILWMVGICLVLEGLGWSLIHGILKKGKALIYWGRFVLINLTFLIPMGLGSYLLLKSLIGIEIGIFEIVVKVLGGIFIVASYFMLISFCLLEEKNIKKLLKKTFLLGVKKIHWILLGAAIGIIGVAIGGGAVYFLMEQGLILMVLSVVLLGVLLVLGKVFLIGVVGEVKKD